MTVLLKNNVSSSLTTAISPRTSVSAAAQNTFFNAIQIGDSKWAL